MERGYTDSVYTNDNVHIGEERRRSDTGTRTHSNPRIRVEQDLFKEVDVRGKELIRRHTDGEHISPTSQSRHSVRSHSARSSIDMDLAYGELPPPLPARHHTEEVEVREKMNKLTLMLDEANALQHSVTSMIEHLQKNPDALAAVALTLAEISNLAAKMAPGALAALKGSFPAAIALLASPQFLIAAGVGVGVTVVMLGGYKIIKRIKDKNALEKELEAPLEMQQLDNENGELDRIEVWRRGIADAECGSPGSTVDGEFITPGAERMLIEEGVLEEDELRAKKGQSKNKSKSSKEKEKKNNHRRSSRDDASSKASRSVGKEKEGRRKKAVGGLKMLFQGHSTTV